MSYISSDCQGNLTCRYMKSIKETVNLNESLTQPLMSFIHLTG